MLVSVLHCVDLEDANVVECSESPCEVGPAKYASQAHDVSVGCWWSEMRFARR